MLKVKVGNAWKQGNNVYVKVGNAWKQAKSIYVKVGNAWKLVAGRLLWIKKADIPKTSWDSCGEFIGNVFYHIPGKYRQDDFIYKYDPVANTWTNTNVTATVRYNAAAATLKNVIYISGGSEGNETGASITDLVDTFDGKTYTRAKTRMPSARTVPCSAASETRVYVIGGESYGGTWARINESFDGTNWQTHASLPTSVRSASAAYWNKKVYVVGGSQTDDVLTKLNQIYDTVANTWSTGAERPEVTNNACAVAYNGQVLSAGGTNSSSYIYNITTNTWSSTLNKCIVNKRDGGFGVSPTGLVVHAGGRVSGNNGASDTQVLQM